MQNRKEKWLKKYEHRRAYLTNRISIKDLFIIASSNTRLSTLETDSPNGWMTKLSTKELNIMCQESTYSSGLETIGDLMIRHRFENTKEVFCMRPWAFCWSSNKSLFMRKAVRVTTKITGPGDPVVEHFYFRPNHYTLWLLKDE